MKKNNLFLLLMFMAMSFWAGSWVSAKILASDTNPHLVIFWRFMITFASFVPLLGIRGRDLKRPDLRGICFTLAAAVFLCGYNILFLTGLKAAMAGKAGVIVTTVNPLITFLLNSLIFGQKVSRDQKIALLIGLSGGIILMEPWGFQQGAFADSSNLYFLGCALCWSSLTILSQQAQKTLSPLWYNALLYPAAALMIVPLLPEDLMGLTAAISATGWFNIVFLAVFAGSLGAGLYFLAAQRLGAPTASTMTFLVPVLALLLSWIFLGEIPHWATVLGGGLSITAVLMINGRIRLRRFQTSP